MLFGKHKNSDEKNKRQQSTILNKYERLKNLIADYLQHHTNRLSGNKKLTGLVCFCLLFTASSLLVIVESFRNQSTEIITSNINRPIIRNESKTNVEDSAITKEQYDSIEVMKARLSKILLDTQQRLISDSIVKLRPHLMDSIEALERMYLQQ